MPSSPLSTTTSPGARPGAAGSLTAGVGVGASAASTVVGAAVAMTVSGWSLEKNAKASATATPTPNRADVPMTKPCSLGRAGLAPVAGSGEDWGLVTVQG